MDNATYNQILFERVHGGDLVASDRIQQRIEWIAGHVPADVRTVLDAGSGRAFLSNRLAYQGLRVTSLDIVLNSAKRSRGQGIQGSVAELPFAPKSFDLVVCTEILEHLSPDVRAACLRELWRVSAAYVLVTVPNDERLGEMQVRCDSCD